MAELQKMYHRFTLSQRLEHWIMAIAFTVLMLTGLPQRFALSFWADPVINLFGGIESARVIHRIAAVVFMLISLYHIIATLYRVYVKRVRLSMLPTLQDAFDLVNSIRYRLGLTREHPKMPRYNFAEKMEYWAVVWGGVLMTITGFMLWNPIATTRLLPGEFVPAAKAAHSAEAWLAFLAIIIWHFYFVHIKVFNKSIFTGKISRELMEEEHAAELAEIESGRVMTPPVPPEIKRKRQQIFAPIAAVITLVGVVGLYRFVTFEQTAITTLPPAQIALAFVPATPTAFPTAFPTPTPRPGLASDGPAAAGSGEGLLAMVPAIPHPLEGQEDCLLCHSLQSFSPFPENHAGWPESTCLNCHALAGETAAATGVEMPHPVQGFEACSQCHQLAALPESHQEAEFNDSECLFCHAPVEAIAAAGQEEAAEEPAEEEVVEEEAAEEPAEEEAVVEEEAAAVAAVPPITHPIQGRENCLVCHDLNAMSPFPENHAGWPESTCLACHAEEGQEPQVTGPAITHPVEGREQCLLCHRLPTLPESHQEAEFSNTECLFCHASEGAQVAGAGEEEAAEEPAEEEEEAAGGITFAGDIQPLLEENCARCHNPDRPFGGLDVTSFDALADVIEPGSPQDSRIVEVMRGRHPYLLVGDNLQLLIDWIAAGAEDN